MEYSAEIDGVIEPLRLEPCRRVTVEMDTDLALLIWWLTQVTSGDPAGFRGKISALGKKLNEQLCRYTYPQSRTKVLEYLRARNGGYGFNIGETGIESE
jgi:hypothetical protein